MLYRTLAPGTVLSGRYQIAEAIGEGELSQVYVAADLRGQAQVALKVFEPSIATRAAALSEYQTLARQASGLGVEGIARAYDFGIDANTGLAFSTAERISWPSLDRHALAHGPLGAGDLRRALGVLARALDAAHASGLVHRDLKPQNVFISPTNPEWVRITDFGVSALRRGSPQAMGWGGPPGYTPPEGVDVAATATVAMDLFALGALAFFALTRGTLFRSLRSPGFDAHAHWSELNQSLSPVSERAEEIGVALDRGFDPWFARALSLQPHERFRSAGELAREFWGAAEQVGSRGGGGPRSMPGIAAAIAQPLVFQPEPSPASLGLPAANAVPAAATQLSSSEDDDVPAGVPKRSKLGLLIGAGVVLLAGVSVAAVALVGRNNGSEGSPAEASAQTSAAQAPTGAPAPTADVAAAPPAADVTATAAAASTTPPAAPVVTPAAAPPRAQQAAPKKPAPATPTPAKPASKPATKPVAEAVKTTAKPAVKPTVDTKPGAKKKKCSTFLGCK